jgi:hypothetical protein
METRLPKERKKRLVVPSQAAVDRSVRRALAKTVESDLDNGSGYLFDLVSWDDLSPGQRKTYQDRIEVAVSRIAAELRHGT